jgi:hypothetical protein
VNIQAAGQDDKNVLVLFTGGQEVFSFFKIPAVATLQEALNIIGIDVLEQL